MLQHGWQGGRHACVCDWSPRVATSRALGGDCSTSRSALHASLATAGAFKNTFGRKAQLWAGSIRHPVGSCGAFVGHFETAAHLLGLVCPQSSTFFGPTTVLKKKA